MDPRIRSSQNADGSRIEIEQLPSDENTTWSMERLHSVCFRTGDATSAETIYDTLGVPRQTVFRSALGEELSQLHYVCDKRGNILEARESESSLAGFRQMGFGPLGVTMVFAAYVLGTLFALLALGDLSDHVGRRA